MPLTLHFSHCCYLLLAPIIVHSISPKIHLEKNCLDSPRRTSRFTRLLDSEQRNGPEIAAHRPVVVPRAPRPAACLARRAHRRRTRPHGSTSRPLQESAHRPPRRADRSPGLSATARVTVAVEQAPTRPPLPAWPRALRFLCASGGTHEAPLACVRACVFKFRLLAGGRRRRAPDRADRWLPGGLFSAACRDSSACRAHNLSVWIVSSRAAERTWSDLRDRSGGRLVSDSRTALHRVGSGACATCCASSI
ncbi:hypothetical protein U9M48_044954 [Paspalum notatum var. saurae]|uniref:Uncharacterized protein n=1 Tax=Paspalum notatum var. saurae TaxID=547442 RepID=A0AAQ3V0M5_PASNO